MALPLPLGGGSTDVMIVLRGVGVRAEGEVILERFPDIAEFNCGVNDLPLSLILSWYEQKAVCILLTLLHLGIKNIRLGPSLPAFVTPAVLNVLIEKFNIMPITTVENDLKACLKAA
jgi:hypothetical protein